jgi:hypothetical protein
VAEVISLLLMLAILVGSLHAPKPTPCLTTAGGWGWVVVLGVIAATEIVLMLTKQGTLSSQMQAWVGTGRWGRLMAIWWVWLVWHLVLEPLVRR